MQSTKVVRLIPLSRKASIQSCTDTKAFYLQEIDKVGIRPDMACAPSVLMSPRSAERQSSVPRGVPIDAETAKEVASQLQTDACVLTAEHFLDPLLTASKPPIVADANKIPALSTLVQAGKPTSILP